jgi:hypothetical protein
MVAATYRCCAASCPCSSRHSEEGDEPPRLEHSASFEWRPQGHGELYLLQPAYTNVRDAEVEAIYEELEDPYTVPEEAVSLEDGANGEDSDMGAEDEGIWLEGDAGFSWEDTRWGQWKWEEENGVWEDESEEDDEEQDHEEEDKDKEEEEEIWE